MRPTDTRKGKDLPHSVEREKSALDAYRERLAVAFALWKARQPAGANRQDDFAREVARNGGRDASQNAVSRWFAGALPRDYNTMRALAISLGTDPGWLYFADISDASAPSIGAFPPVPPAPNIVPPSAFKSGAQVDAERVAPATQKHAPGARKRRDR